MWHLSFYWVDVEWCFNPHTYMRCDGILRKTGSAVTCFNPHTYMRCDTFRFHSCLFRCVSIHTPTWGVTSVVWPNILNSTFQSTHLHEVWRRSKTTIMAIHCFNPHTYMRCDSGLTPLDHIVLVSIHTPTWGVTVECGHCFECRKFQSTHLHEVWPRVTFRVPRAQRFNPHTYMRCDRNSTV